MGHVKGLLAMNFGRQIDNPALSYEPSAVDNNQVPVIGT
jgi:hypothetical protein